MIDFNYFITNIISNDKKAWKYFLDNFKGLIYSNIIKIISKTYKYNNEHIIQDIYDIILIHMIKDNFKVFKLFKGTTELSFASYIKRLSINKTIDWLRKNKSQEVTKSLVFHQEDSYYNYDSIDRAIDLERAINVLTPKQYLLYKMIYEENKDSVEIANVMNLKLNALHQLKYRLFKNLYKFINR